MSKLVIYAPPECPDCGWRQTHFVGTGEPFIIATPCDVDLERDRP